MTFNFLVVYQVSLSEKKKVVWGLGGCFLDCLGCVEELRESVWSEIKCETPFLESRTQATPMNQEIPDIGGY